MSDKLPRLRGNLDFMPSPVPERPGLLIRDPYQYSPTTLIIPPALVECLRFYDGNSTGLDLHEVLYRLTSELRTSELEQHLTEALSQAGFLENEVYRQMRDERHREFAASAIRESAHAGGAYSNEPDELRGTLDRYLGAREPVSSPDGLIGIAAPHVSPQGGWESYQAAYRALGPQHAEKIFVILGTSHYGEPDRFGLTRKAFVTPLGVAATEGALVDELAARAPDAVMLEDYCHATEHSIEFQVVFLQHLYGPGVRIVPILCGAFGRSLYGGGPPEDEEPVRAFLGALGELAAREKQRLVWVLGVDMAHMGRRYGDRSPARAGGDLMEQVAGRDRGRIDRINAGDAAGFWELVQENHDDLKWCGSAPIYTFLKAVPEARGQLLHYQQWNIDEESVVSFAGLSFSG